MAARLSPGPLIRGLVAAAALLGALLIKQLHVLAAGYVVVWALLTCNRIVRAHAKFLVVGMLPVALGVLFLWGWVVGAPPGQHPGSNPIGGVEYGLMVSVRLALVGGVFQLSFLPLPFGELMSLLARWGMRGDSRIFVACAFTLWPELKLRAEQIITARYARGLVRNRSFFSTARQFPYLLRPLLTWSLYAGIQRADMWHQQGLLRRAEETTGVYNGSVVGNVVFLLLAVAWLGCAWVTR